jgi:hypothetical protein
MDAQPSHIIPLPQNEKYSVPGNISSRCFVMGAEARSKQFRIEEVRQMRIGTEPAPGLGIAGKTCAAIIDLAALLCAGTAYAAPEFNQIDLISDGAVPAQQPPDPSLINPGGVAYSPTGPFWVSDNDSGVVTICNSSGTKQSLFGGTVPQVTVATPPGQTPGTAAPDGQVFNGSGGFNVTETVNGTPKTGSSAFIVATEALFLRCDPLGAMPRFGGGGIVLEGTVHQRASNPERLNLVGFTDLMAAVRQALGSTAAR